MSKKELETVAQSMVAKGKGILAADESMGTIKRRFDSIKIESNENTRRAYREMLFTTKGIEEAISGVILFDETIRTSTSDGTPFPQLLAKSTSWGLCYMPSFFLYPVPSGRSGRCTYKRSCPALCNRHIFQ